MTENRDDSSFYTRSIRTAVIPPVLLLVLCGCGNGGHLPEDDLEIPELPTKEQPLVYSLSFDDQAWEELHLDPFADVEVPAILVFDDEEYTIGVEIQGSSARHFPKKSYKLKFKGAGFEGNPFGDEGGPDVFHRIILKAMYKDQSLIREAIAFDIWRLMDIPAPRVGLATLYINDEYWGLYEIVERIDEGYLQRNSYPPGGNLYKAVRKHGGYADFKPGRDLKLAFEKKTNEEGPWDDLEELVDLLQNVPLEEEAFLESIDPIFSLDAYFKRMIWVSYTQNTDGKAQNFFLYNAPVANIPSWSIIPWDSDICLSNHWSLDVPLMPPEDYPLLDGGNYFGPRLLSVDGLREQYLDLFEEMLATVFTRGRIDPIVSHYFDLAREELARDLLRWERTSTVDEEFAEITLFFEKRPSILKELLVASR